MSLPRKERSACEQNFCRGGKKRNKSFPWLRSSVARSGVDKLPKSTKNCPKFQKVLKLGPYVYMIGAHFSPNVEISPNLVTFAAEQRTNGKMDWERLEGKMLRQPVIEN
jgi:hypothetical protein